MTISTVPLFWDSEVRCGRQLGQGTYCTVTAVQDILLSSEDNHPDLPPPLHAPTVNTKVEGETTEEVVPAQASNNASRERLANKFAVTRHKKKDPNAAIYGKPTGPPKEMDDPEQEPAPKLALKRVRKLKDAADMQTAKADFQLELRRGGK